MSNNYEVNLKKQDYIHSIATVADIPNVPKYQGMRIEWSGYHEEGDGGGNFGFVYEGAHTPDRGKIFSIDANTYIAAAHNDTSIDLRKWGSVPNFDSSTYVSDSVTEFDSAPAMQSALDFLSVSPMPRAGGVRTLNVHGSVLIDGTMSFKPAQDAFLRVVGHDDAVIYFNTPNDGTGFDLELENILFKNLYIYGVGNFTDANNASIKARRLVRAKNGYGAADVDIVFEDCVLSGAEYGCTTYGRGASFFGGGASLLDAVLNIVPTTVSLNSSSSFYIKEPEYQFRRYLFGGMSIDNCSTLVMITGPESWDGVTVSKIQNNIQQRYINNINISNMECLGVNTLIRDVDYWSDYGVAGEVPKNARLIGTTVTGITGVANFKSSFIDVHSIKNTHISNVVGQYDHDDLQDVEDPSYNLASFFIACTEIDNIKMSNVTARNINISLLRGATHVKGAQLNNVTVSGSGATTLKLVDSPLTENLKVNNVDQVNATGYFIITEALTPTTIAELNVTNLTQGGVDVVPTLSGGIDYKFGSTVVSSQASRTVAKIGAVYHITWTVNLLSNVIYDGLTFNLASDIPIKTDYSGTSFAKGFSLGNTVMLNSRVDFVTGAEMGTDNVLYLLNSEEGNNRVVGENLDVPRTVIVNYSGL